MQTNRFEQKLLPPITQTALYYKSRVAQFKPFRI